MARVPTVRLPGGEAHADTVVALLPSRPDPPVEDTGQNEPIAGVGGAAGESTPPCDSDSAAEETAATESATPGTAADETAPPCGSESSEDRAAADDPGTKAETEGTGGGLFGFIVDIFSSNPDTTDQPSE